MRLRSPLLALVAALWLLVAACTGGSAAGEPPPGPSAVATQTPASTPATATATATSTPVPLPTSPPAGERLLGAYTGVAHTKPDPSFRALEGTTVEFGELGKTVYRIELPANWNGELLMWSHGFKGFETELDVDSPPRALREWLIAHGYAWAASSYSENGYVPGIGADETLALKRYFEAQYGEATRTYIAGYSMGGHVVALSMEELPGEYDGALAMCGVVGGQTQIDYLVSWGVVAAFLAGTEIPLGGGAFALGSALVNGVAPALGEPTAPTQAGLQFESVIREMTGGPRPFFMEGYLEQYLVNFAFVLSDPDLESLTTRAATNVGIVYEIEGGLGVTADTINAGVLRFEADPTARNGAAHPDKVPTTGNLSAPMLTLHNTGDLFVPISQEQQYRAAVEALGKGDLLVQRAIRAGGHCEFSDEEITQAFADLVGWVETGEKPAGDDLTGDLTDIGMAFTNPLREGDPGGR